MKRSKLIKMQDIVFGTVAISSLFLLVGASSANAATSAVDDVTITVPASCSLTNTIGSAHTATIETGVYQDDIGETTFKVTCNDAEGFSVYAIGYTDDTYGNTTMKPSTLADTNSIATGLATSGDTSNWAMKLTAVTGDYAPTLETGFNAYHAVPSEYTKVASFASNTDSSSGSSFKSTYAAFIASAQPADTYAGKVKYTVVHPSNVDAPALAMLDTGANVNKKMKSVASNTTVSSAYTSDTLIKSFQRSNTLPNDFVATTTNTISLTTSGIPIHIFFDNTDNAGIMYYYARDNATIITNSNSSYLFSYMKALTEVPGLADWDTGNVTNMYQMFYSASSLTDISGLSNWDTAKVTDMSYMFSYTKITNVDALIPNKNNNPNIWNTGNVTNMQQMFDSASSLTDISGLANWDTAKVTDMSLMFYSTKIANVDALVPNKNNNPNIWNTGNVTNMGGMFGDATSLTDISGLSNWDTAKVTSMSSMFNSTKITNVDALVPNKNNNPNIWNTGNVTDMNSMFDSATSLTDISGLANWDTAKVTNMSYMFSHASSLTDISGLANWDTAKVTNMSYMFSHASSLANISPIAGWNVSRVTATAGGTTSSNKFYQMFYSVPSAVTSGFVFTNRTGSIDSYGTYVVNT